MARKAEFPEREMLTALVLEVCDEVEIDLDLGWVQVSHVFCDSMAGEESDDLETTAAVTLASWEYRTATITWYLPMVACMHRDRIKLCAIHEYVHVLLGPIKEHIKTTSHALKLEELATENVARAIVSALAATP